MYRAYDDLEMNSENNIKREEQKDFYGSKFPYSAGSDKIIIISSL